MEELLDIYVHQHITFHCIHLAGLSLGRQTGGKPCLDGSVGDLVLDVM
jgi:hypothetical protein